MYCEIEPKCYPLGLFLNAVVKNIHQGILLPRSAFKARIDPNITNAKIGRAWAAYTDKCREIFIRHGAIQTLAKMKFPKHIDRNKLLQFFCETYGIEEDKFKEWYYGKPVKLGLISHCQVILREES